MSHIKFFLRFYLTFLALKCSNSATNKCGQSSVGLGNVIGGYEAPKNIFPWMSAIILASNRQFFCGGTLVTSKKVLSAAHCFLGKEQVYPLLARDIKVLLGVYDLDDPFETGRVTSTVEFLDIHPHWNHNIKSFDADLSLLILEDDVVFNKYIQPICIDFDEKILTKSSGLVLGYGKSEDPNKIHEKKPRFIETPIHDNNDCLTAYPSLAPLASNRTVCGGKADGRGVCRGDSGGGLVVYHDKTFYLRAVVSSSLFTITEECDVNIYSVFTDIYYYKNWILNGVVDPRPIFNANDLSQNDKELIEKIQSFSSRSCGLSKVGETEFKKSKEIVPHSFPWFAALQRKYSKGDFFFICGGTLVSEEKVVTAAHCIQEKYQGNPRRPDELRVLLGVHNLEDSNEIGRETFGVSNIIIHPDWDTRSKNFDADLTILILDRKVKFNNFIQPICVFGSELNVESIDKGVVIGYGNLDEEDEEQIHRSTPKLLVMPIIYNRECLVEFSDLAISSSKRTFCGGWKNDTNIWKGDNGGGLYVKSQGALYLRGIASAPLFGGTAYRVYTDVLKFKDWINSINGN